MSQIFPYGITIGADGAIVVVPTVEVAIAGTDRAWRTLYFILDSGATISALPRGDATALGVDITRGSPLTMSGFTREPMRAWRHDLAIRLGAEKLRIPVAFLDSDDVPRVLGREGVFERFTIIFEERQHRSGCIDVGSAEGARVRAIMEALRSAS